MSETGGDALRKLSNLTFRIGQDPSVSAILGTFRDVFTDRPPDSCSWFEIYMDSQGEPEEIQMVDLLPHLTDLSAMGPLVYGARVRFADYPYMRLWDGRRTEPLIISDVVGDPQLTDALRTFLTANALTAFIQIPIVYPEARAHTLLVMSWYNGQQSFSQEERLIVNSLANSVSASIIAQRLISETRRAADYSQRVALLNARLSQSATSNVVLGVLGDLFEHDNADSIFWYNGRSGTDGLLTSLQLGQALSPTDFSLPFAGQAQVHVRDQPALAFWDGLASAQRIVEEVDSAPDLDEAARVFMQAQGIQAFLSIPVKISDGPLRIILLLAWRAARVFSNQERQLVELLGTTLSATVNADHALRQTRRYAAQSEALVGLTNQIARVGTSEAILEAFWGVFDEEPGYSAVWFNIRLDSNGKPQAVNTIGVHPKEMYPIKPGTSNRGRVNLLEALDLWKDGGRQPVMVSDIENDPRINPDFRGLLEDSNIRALVMIPTLIPDDINQVLISLFWQNGEHFFTEDDARRLDSLASTLAVSVQAHRSAAEMETRARNMERLALTGKAAAAILDSERLVHSLGETLRETFALKKVLLYLYQADTELLIDTDGRHMLPLAASDNPLAQVAREGSALLDGRRLWVSLTTGDELIGALELETEGVFTTADHAVHVALSQQLANAIVNARRYEESLRTAAQLKEADRLKTEFLANMSHELRTPLNAIKGYADLSLMYIRDSSRAPDWGRATVAFEVIAASSTLLTNRVDALLDIGKIEAGRMEIIRETFRVSEMIDVVLEVTLPGKKPPVEFEHKVDPALDMLTSDRTKLERILINLLSNAFKFTEKGVVKLDMRKLDDKEWEMRVSDTGIGVPVHAQDYIFDKFRQVDGSTQRSYGGSGLGLSIVRSLCWVLGGAIRLESIVHEGSVFIATFPFLEESETDVA